MSDNNIFTEDILSPEFLSDDIETAADESAGPSLIEKALKWIIIVIVVLIGGELILLLVVNPCLPLSRVEVTGMPELDMAMVLKQAGITRRSSYVSVNSRKVEAHLKALSAVASAKVIKGFPNSVRIVLEGRKAVALSFVMLNGKVCPVFFDYRGVVFKIGYEVHETAASLSIPIITGLLTEQPFLGMQLPFMSRTLLSDLARIQEAAPELLAAISEITVTRKAFDSYDVILYPVHNPVRIRLGSEVNESMLRYVLLVIDVCVAKGTKIEEIDFRTGTASYTIKGASSG
ncbi:MAG: FtsQ-type POTRA domain-containing protein [Treponema sp.]|jgi:cell division protein FtsQ|nr:FtsQ-type POTRA domain-containing protein [Treponema sp.]